MGLANWLQFLVLAVKYPRGVFLRKNGSLRELRHQAFRAFLMTDWVCCRFLTVRGVAHGEDYGLEFYGGTCSEV